MDNDRVYRFAEKVGRFYSQPEKATELIRQINDLCDSKPGLHWNQLPYLNKSVQLKSLVRFSAPYNGKDELGRRLNWTNMDIVILGHVKKRLEERDNTEPSFLRVYNAFQKHLNSHKKLPNCGYIISRMLPELASPQAREVDAMLRRNELSHDRTLEAQEELRDDITDRIDRS